MCVAGRCCDIKSCHKMFQGKIPNLTKCENICHLSLQKFVWRRKKATFKKCGENVQQKRNDVNHVIKTHTVAFSFHVFYTNWIFKCKKIPWTMFSYYLISKWNFESWYATKYRYFKKTYMITFLHLKMGKSLHESETSNDNDIVYGVLVEIWLELIIQNRAREKKENLCERNPK